MNLRSPRIIGAALVVIIGAALAPAANAIEHALSGGPPTTSTPGPYYNQGDFLGLCVANPGSGAADYIERNTNFGTRATPNPAALGNCAAHHVQAVLLVDPSLYPIPAASASPSATPTPSATASPSATATSTSSG